MRDYAVVVSDKSKKKALICCGIGGFFGVHLFYVGKIGLGILYFFTGGLFVFGWLVDLVKISVGRFTDNSGAYLRERDNRCKINVENNYNFSSKICNNCGRQLNENSKFCDNCGSEVQTDTILKDNDGGALKQNHKEPVYTKFWFWLLVVFFIVFLFGALGVSLDDDDPNISTEQQQIKEKYLAFDDEYLMNDFLTALSEINADEKKVTSFAKQEDWAGGKRFSFLYDDKIFLNVYCNMGSTVDSINYKDVKIYYRGYEPYDINDYIYNSSVCETLMSVSREKVKLFLNYPLTAEFSYLSSNWGVARYKNIYYLNSYVDAKNGFGVESRLNFTVAYTVNIDGESVNGNLIYLNLDGDIKINNVDNYTDKTVRKIKEPTNKNKNENIIIDGINLVYGQLGEYGKSVTIDGEIYINYYISSGKYLVQNNGNMGTVFVASDEMYKNSDGYMENVDLKVYTFSIGSNGTTQEIEIPEGYHIELSMHTNITLKKID